VVVLAQEEARMLNHNYIGTEHVLLALIHEREGVAAKALESLNISLEAARRQVKDIIGTGQLPSAGHIPLTPRTKKVLELSLRESLQLGHNYIGTEHILLGLIREGEGIGAQVLQNLGADRNRVRQTVIQLLTGYGAGMEAMPTEAWTPPSGPTCPSCSLPLEGALAYRTVLAEPADEEGDPISLLVLYCRSCGATVRTSLEGGDHPPAIGFDPFDTQED
jgi:ATP-dependent Clp protease ATP-binding subunit ClpA